MRKRQDLALDAATAVSAMCRDPPMSTAVRRWGIRRCLQQWPYEAVKDPPMSTAVTLWGGEGSADVYSSDPMRRWRIRRCLQQWPYEAVQDPPMSTWPSEAVKDPPMSTWPYEAVKDPPMSTDISDPMRRWRIRRCLHHWPYEAVQTNQDINQRTIAPSTSSVFCVPPLMDIRSNRNKSYRWGSNSLVN